MMFLKSVPELENGEWKLSGDRELDCDNKSWEDSSAVDANQVIVENNKTLFGLLPLDDRPSFHYDLSGNESVKSFVSAVDGSDLSDSDNSANRKQLLDQDESSLYSSQSNVSDTTSSFSILEYETTDATDECESSEKEETLEIEKQKTSEKKETLEEQNPSEEKVTSEEQKDLKVLQTDMNGLSHEMTTLFEDISGKLTQVSSDSDSTNTDSSMPLLEQVLLRKKSQGRVAKRPSTATADLPIQGKLRFLNEDVGTLLNRVEAKKRDIDRRKEVFNDRLSDLKHGRNLTISNLMTGESSSETSTSVSSMRTDTSSSSGSSSLLNTDGRGSTMSEISSTSTDTVVGDDLGKMEEELDLISANLDEILALTGLK